MNDILRKTGRTESIDQAVGHNLDGEKFRNFQFCRLVASKKVFTNCDFSYTEFDSCYLRNCTFDSCTFIGSRFKGCNLRGSKFVGCKFDYAEFSNTHVEPDILASNCPGQENLQQKFARTLRLNFQQIGDSKAANTAIRIELDATRVHLKKAWSSREAYYRKKYSGFDRFKVFLEWIEFVALDFYWGNGESPLKLFRSLMLLLVLIAVGDAVTFMDAYDLHSYATAVLRAPNILLGVTKPLEFSGSALAAIAASRYIMFACLVSILIKRLSKR